MRTLLIGVGSYLLGRSGKKHMVETSFLKGLIEGLPKGYIVALDELLREGVITKEMYDDKTEGL